MGYQYLNSSASASNVSFGWVSNGLGCCGVLLVGRNTCEMCGRSCRLGSGVNGEIGRGWCSRRRSPNGSGFMLMM